MRKTEIEEVMRNQPAVMPDLCPGWPPKFPHPWPLQNPPPE